MSTIKQSTAYTRMFKMIDSADHLSPKTGLTPTVNISKAGGAFGAAGGTVTEVANGWYKIALTTTDTNTLGDLAYYITSAGADDTDFVDQVTANVLGDTLPVNVTQIDGNATNGNNATLNLKQLNVVNSAGDAIVASATGSNGQGINASGNGAGSGIKGTGGATGNGIQAAGGATSGSAIKAAGTAGNAIALELAGQGSAAALSATGGATGAAAKFIGGGTSGDGIDISTTAGDGIAITPTAGNAIVATANGTSKHGIVATGGTAGTSDGLKCVAGTGGVDLRAAIAGNITGNVSGSVGSVSAGVTVTTNNDKTGYSLTQSFPANFSSLAITAGGAVTVGTNSDKTGYSIASGGIINGAHAAAEINNLADGYLDRIISVGTDSGADDTTHRTVRQALRVLRNKVSISGGVLTITKEDDSTASWTGAVTTTAGNPISQVDPT